MRRHFDVTGPAKLFLGDPEEDFAFTRDVQLQAADLTPWLERMRRLKLEALAR